MMRKRGTIYDHDKIAHLRKLGLTRKQIADQTGASRSLIRLVIARAGLAQDTAAARHKRTAP